MGGRGACTGKEGFCGPGKNVFLEHTIFLEQTTIYYIEFPSGTPITNLTITWSLADSTAPSDGSTLATL